MPLPDASPRVPDFSSTSPSLVLDSDDRPVRIVPNLLTLDSIEFPARAESRPHPHPGHLANHRRTNRSSRRPTPLCRLRTLLGRLPRGHPGRQRPIHRPFFPHPPAESDRTRFRQCPHPPRPHRERPVRPARARSRRPPRSQSHRPALFRRWNLLGSRTNRRLRRHCRHLRSAASPSPSLPASKCAPASSPPPPSPSKPATSTMASASTASSATAAPTGTSARNPPPPSKPG